jgi:hypothetical protein
MDNCILRQGLIESLKRANARGEPRARAGARHERRLLRVGSSAWFGAARRQFPALDCSLCQPLPSARVPSYNWEYPQRVPPCSPGIPLPLLRDGPLDGKRRGDAPCGPRADCGQGNVWLHDGFCASRGVQDRPLDFLRHLKDHEERRGIQVILTALINRIFRKRVFKLLLLNQSLRRKFAGSRLPTS